MLLSDLALYLIDTFTDKIFHGQATAVCLLAEELNDELLVAIALENKYPETVFVRLQHKQWYVRWFNAQGEIYGTGHGSIAVAAVLFEQYHLKSDTIILNNALGQTTIHRDNDRLYLEYPITHATLGLVTSPLSQYFSIQPLEIWQNGPDLIAYFEHQADVENLNIQVDALKNLVSGALIATAPSTEVDIYSRCFLPRLAGYEETATPAVYPRLLRFWQQKTPKNQYKAFQGLMRRSEIHVMSRDHHIWVGGNCRCYFRGELLL